MYWKGWKIHKKIYKKHGDFRLNCVDRFSDTLPPHGVLR